MRDLEERLHQNMRPYTFKHSYSILSDITDLPLPFDVVTFTPVDAVGTYYGYCPLIGSREVGKIVPPRYFMYTDLFKHQVSFFLPYVPSDTDLSYPELLSNNLSPEAIQYYRDHNSTKDYPETLIRRIAIETLNGLFFYWYDHKDHPVFPENYYLDFYDFTRGTFLQMDKAERDLRLMKAYPFRYLRYQNISIVNIIY